MGSMTSKRVMNNMKVSTMMNTMLMVSSVAPRIIFQQQPDQGDNLNGIFPRDLLSNQSTYCPDDLDWCDEPYHYPEHDILKVVTKQKKAVKIMFDKDDVPSPENKTNEIGLRMFESEFENICDVDTTYIKPRAAKNKEGKFMFIVNHPEGADEYIQLCHHAVPPGVLGPQVGGPQCHWGGVGCRHLLLSFLLFLPYQYRAVALV